MRAMEDFFTGRYTKPLIPRLMESPDEEPDQRRATRQLCANDEAGAWKRNAAAVQEDAFEDLLGQGLETRALSACMP